MCSCEVGGSRVHAGQRSLHHACRKPILLQRAQPSSNPSAEQPAAAIRGRISMVRSNKHRSLDISLEYSAVSADGVCAVSQLAIYELAVSGAKG